MPNTSKLAQIPDLLLQNLNHPDAAKLSNALKLLFGVLEARAIANHKRTQPDTDFNADALLAFGTAFTNCIVNTHKDASIFDALLQRSSRLLTADQISQAAYSRLQVLLIDSINHDLESSCSIIIAQAQSFGFSQTERTAVEYMYRSNTFMQQTPAGFDEPPTTAPAITPANITALVLALSTVFSMAG